jgi:hypothetical protein
MWRAFAVMLLVYVALDFCDPNLPGALNFDLDQSIDAVHTQVRGQLPVCKPSILSASPNADDPRLLTSLEVSTVRSCGVHLARRNSSYVRPRALLSEASPPGSTEPH